MYALLDSTLSPPNLMIFMSDCSPPVTHAAPLESPMKAISTESLRDLFNSKKTNQSALENWPSKTLAENSNLKKTNQWGFAPPPDFWHPRGELTPNACMFQRPLTPLNVKFAWFVLPTHWGHRLPSWTTVCFCSRKRRPPSPGIRGPCSCGRSGWAASGEELLPLFLLSIERKR